MMLKRLGQKEVRYAVYGLAILIAMLFIIPLIAKKGLPVIHVEELSDYLRSFGVYSIGLGMLSAFLQPIIPVIPFMLIAGANTLVFGLFTGYIINYTMAVLGSISAFLLIRRFSQERLNRWLSKYDSVRSFNSRMEKHGFLYVLLGRLIPFLPSTAVNVGAAAVKIKVRDFVFATMLGKLFPIALDSFIGHDLIHFHEYKGRLLVLGAVTVLLLVTGYIWRNRWLGKTAE